MLRWTFWFLIKSWRVAVVVLGRRTRMHCKSEIVYVISGLSIAQLVRLFNT